MLYLITGQPGSGKTLYMVSQMMSNPDLTDREIYVDGIQDLDREKVNYHDIPEGHSVDDWYDWLPAGSILVIDECQRYFRPRPNGSPVPQKVTELETHRHKGVDLFLITQHPRLIDVNVRSFVENHKHFGKTNLGNRRMFEWPRCGNPDSRTDAESALVSVYMLDKKAMGVYHSAEVHTKIKVGRSKWIYVFPILVILLIASLWGSWSFISTFGRAELADATNQTVDDAQPAPQQVGQAVASHTGMPAAESASQPDNKLKAEDWEPAIEGQPWTAPIYNGQNRNIQTMPYPVACIENGSKCTCYTEQATPINGMKHSLCLQYVREGIYNPYKQHQATQDSHTAAPAPIGGASVSVLDGSAKPNLSYSSDAPRSAQ